MSRARTTRRARGALSPARGRAPDALHTIERPRLFALLDRAQVGAWIHGPGGSGKTSLASSWLSARSTVNVWITLDAADSEPASFFTSLGMAAPESAKLPTWDARCAPALGAFARQFFCALYAALPRSVALVFDQCEQLSEAGSIQAALVAALDVAPTGVRLLMLSRRSAPSALARWCLDARFVRIDGDALRMSDPEAVALACAAGADAARVVALNDHVRGWAAGLRLLLCSPAGELDGSRERELIFDYFATQMFAGLSAVAQSVLLCCAVLPWVDVRWATELSGEAEASSVLAALCRDRMFVDGRAQGESRVYVFHPLLREFLCARVDRRGLSWRAAALMEADGALDAAAQLRIDVQAWEPLVAQIEAHAPALLEGGRAHQLERWLAALPDAVCAERPTLCLWRGACVGPRDPRRARVDLERAYHAFVACGELRAALRCLGWLLQGFFVEWGEYAALDPWIARLEAHVADCDPPWPTELLSGSLGLLFRRPEHALLERFTSGQVARAHAAAQPEAQLQMAMLAAQTSFWRGDLVRARAGLADVEDSFAEASVGTQVMYALTCALLEWHQGHADAGLRWSERALSTCRDYGLMPFAASAYLLQSDCYLAKGDLVAAEHALAAGGSATSRGRYLERQQYKLNLALAHARAGRVAEARDLMGQVGEPRADAPIFAALSLLTLAQLHMLVGEPERAEPLLMRALALSERSRADYLRWSALLGLACAKGEAALLEAAFALARERAYVSTFIWIPEQVAHACNLTLALGVERAYACTLIEARGLAAPRGAGDQWPFPLRLRALGAFTVDVRGCALAAGRKEQKKPLELLKLLIAQPGQRARCTFLQAQLWPELELEAARNAFDLALHRLRKRIALDKAVRLEDGELMLDARWVWSDVAAFEPACQRLERAREGECEAAVRALFDIYRGDFLAGEEGRWVHAPRERMRSRLLRCLHQVSRASPSFAFPLELWQRAVELDPLWEDAQRALMICLAQQQRPLEANESYRRFRLTLARTHGIEPSLETRQAYATYLRGHLE